MGALDKLNNRIQQEEHKEGTSEKKDVIKQQEVHTAALAKTESKKKDAQTAAAKKEEPKLQSKTSKKAAVSPKSEKNKIGEASKNKETATAAGATAKSDPLVTEKKKMGRKPTRGIRDVDYKMLNIAVPMDVYDGLIASYGGNLTYHINSILREAIK